MKFNERKFYDCGSWGPREPQFSTGRAHSVRTQKGIPLEENIFSKVFIMKHNWTLFMTYILWESCLYSLSVKLIQVVRTVGTKPAPWFNDGLDGQQWRVRRRGKFGHTAQKFSANVWKIIFYDLWIFSTIFKEVLIIFLIVFKALWKLDIYLQIKWL